MERSEGIIEINALFYKELSLSNVISTLVIKNPEIISYLPLYEINKMDFDINKKRELKEWDKLIKN